MTKKEIIEMAEKAGITISGEAIFRLCELVEKHERIACANVCDDELKKWGIFDSDVGDVSKAIRARGQE